MAETVFDGVLFMMRERGVKVVSLVFFSVHICVSGENVFCEANHNCKFFFFFLPCITYQCVGILVQAVVEAQREEDPGKSHCWLTWVLLS